MAEPPPSIFRRSTFDIDIETLDERPWLRPGRRREGEYFNYGLTPLELGIYRQVRQRAARARARARPSARRARAREERRGVVPRARARADRRADARRARLTWLRVRGEPPSPSRPQRGARARARARQRQLLIKAELNRRKLVD